MYGMHYRLRNKVCRFALAQRANLWPGRRKKMVKIIMYIWIIFSVMVILKAYYDTAKDVIEWIRKKIKIKEEKKEDVESTD